MDDLEQPVTQDSEAAANAAEEVTTEAEHEEVPESESSAESAQDEDEDDVEYEGKQYRLPKNLKEALLRQADYTRKTQEVAEQRRAIEAHAQQVRQQAEFQQKFVEEIADVVAINKRIAEFDNLNWQQLIDQDPVGAMKLQHEYQALQQNRNLAVQNLTQKQQQAALEQQQEIARRSQEGQAALKRDIPDWNQDKAKQVVDYMTKLGASQEELSKVHDPAFVKAFWKAQLYDQLVAKQTAKPKGPTQEKPVTRITAVKAAANKDPDRMSPDEWLRWRNKQLSSR